MIRYVFKFSSFLAHIKEFIAGIQIERIFQKRKEYICLTCPEVKFESFSQTAELEKFNDMHVAIAHFFFSRSQLAIGYLHFYSFCEFLSTFYLAILCYFIHVRIFIIFLCDNFKLKKSYG